ncbi:MAG: hypothetical protein ACKOXD_05675 [Acinetobacter sp.]
MQSITKPKRLAAFEDMSQANIKTKILSYMTHQHVCQCGELCDIPDLQW